MSERTLTICHAADLCLGAVPKDWAVLPEDPSLQEVLLDAPFIAFRSLVDRLLERPPSAVLLTGTLFDTPRPDVCSWLRFEREIQRLLDAGCAVVIACMERDATAGGPSRGAGGGAAPSREADEPPACENDEPLRRGGDEPPNPLEELAARHDGLLVLEPGETVELAFDQSPHVLRVHWADGAEAAEDVSCSAGMSAGAVAGSGRSGSFDVVLMAAADLDAVAEGEPPSRPAASAAAEEAEASHSPPTGRLAGLLQSDYLGVFGVARHRSAVRDHRCVQFLTALQPMAFGCRPGYAAMIEWDGERATVLQRLYTAPLRWVSVRCRVDQQDDPLRLAESFDTRLQRCNVHANERLWLCRCVCEGSAAELAHWHGARRVSQLQRALQERLAARNHGVPCVLETELMPLPADAVEPSNGNGSPLAAIEQFFAACRRDVTACDQRLAEAASRLPGATDDTADGDLLRRLLATLDAAECVLWGELFARAWLAEPDSSERPTDGARSEPDAAAA